MARGSVSEVGNLKWIEAGLLLAAGVAFGWWQLRDVKRAQEEARRRREADAAQTPQGSPQSSQAPSGGNGDKGP